MVKHIVMWNFKEDVPEGEKKAIKEKAKKELEALVGVVPGLISAFVITEPLSSSSHDFCLVTELETLEALAAYAVNPNHQNVANTYVRPYTCNRAAMDYMMD